MTGPRLLFDPIYDEHEHGCPARVGLGECDEKPKVEYRVLRLCAICGIRREEMTVLMDDIPTGLCAECFYRGDEEARDGS